MKKIAKLEHLVCPKRGGGGLKPTCAPTFDCWGGGGGCPRCPLLLRPCTTKVDFMLRVSKSYIPFTCKSSMVIHFVPILFFFLHKSWGPKIFLCFWYRQLIDYNSVQFSEISSQYSWRNSKKYRSVLCGMGSNFNVMYAVSALRVIFRLHVCMCVW